MIVPIALWLAVAADESARLLPDGPGKETTGKVCAECHDTGNIRKQRLTRDEWAEKIAGMADRGAKGTDAEMAAVLDNLARWFGPGAKIFINTAPYAEIKSILALSNAEAAAVVAYRKENGNFQQVGDLLKVPGVDARKIEAKKDLLAF